MVIVQANDDVYSCRGGTPLLDLEKFLLSRPELGVRQRVGLRLLAKDFDFGGMTIGFQFCLALATLCKKPLAIFDIIETLR